jgi:hypothetical protein
MYLVLLPCEAEKQRHTDHWNVLLYQILPTPRLDLIEIFHIFRSDSARKMLV